MLVETMDQVYNKKKIITKNKYKQNTLYIRKTIIVYAFFNEINSQTCIYT